MEVRTSITFRIDPATKAALERLAGADGRSVGNLCRKILRQFITPATKGKAKP